MDPLYGLSVWAIGEDYVDFVAAKTLDEAITHYLNETGVGRDEICGDLIREAGWNTTIHDPDEVIGKDENDKPIYRGYTLRELALAKETFPAIIAMTGDY